MLAGGSPAPAGGLAGCLAVAVGADEDADGRGWAVADQQSGSCINGVSTAEVAAEIGVRVFLSSMRDEEN